MKGSGWALRLIFVAAAAVTLALAGDASAGDKKGKKDKKDKKDKKGKEEVIIRKDYERIWCLIDPTRPHKYSRKGRSGGR